MLLIKMKRSGCSSPAAHQLSIVSQPPEKERIMKWAGRCPQGSLPKKEGSPRKMFV